MHSVSDTIVTVSSPSGGVRSLLRLTGPQTLTICRQIFQPGLDSEIHRLKSKILPGTVRVGDALEIDVWLYLFFAPRSYTGEDLAEIHVTASRVIVEALMQELLARGLRSAGPGEFTARAYLNGKLDLAQAEAVNEIISSSNRLQLDAAEQLLSGRLTKAAAEIHASLLDVLSLIEAGLDFSGEDIEFIGTSETAERLTTIRQSLEELLAGSIRCETLVDLPAIGIAGAPNAGKSSLLNALLGWERSLVSPQPRTTRDVLTGVLTTDRFQCVLFDCAGLVPVAGFPNAMNRVWGPSPPPGVIDDSRGRRSYLDQLAQRAAIEALRHCAAVLFCVDSTQIDLSDDLAIRPLIRSENVIHVATKSDLLPAEHWSRKMKELEHAFGARFLATSAKTAFGLPEALGSIERIVICDGAEGTAGESAIRDPQSEISTLALTTRHRKAVTEALENVRQAITEVTGGHEEVAVMMIRAACQAVSHIEQQPLDEQVLDRIFSRFCIGK